MPTAYPPAAGSSKSTFLRKKRSGTCNKIPAPSPLSGSLPDAPRCSRLVSALRAFTTMSWLGIPVRVATNATPHASCSRAGSYRPCALGCRLIAIFILLQRHISHGLTPNMMSSTLEALQHVAENSGTTLAREPYSIGSTSISSTGEAITSRPGRIRLEITK